MLKGKSEIFEKGEAVKPDTSSKPGALAGKDITNPLQLFTLNGVKVSPAAKEKFMKLKGSKDGGK